MDDPKKKPIIVIAIVLLIAGGWWYFSKYSDCVGRVSYFPANAGGSNDGAHYQLDGVNALAFIGGGGRSYATRSEAISACMAE